MTTADNYRALKLIQTLDILTQYERHLIDNELDALWDKMQAELIDTMDIDNEVGEA